MNENSQTNPPETTSASEAKVPSGKDRKPRRWRRRFLWCAGTVFILAVLFRLSLPYLLPWTLQKIASDLDLECKYDRLELSMLGGDAELWHLTIAPPEGGEAFFHAEYCRADLSTPHLLLGRLVIRRLESDGVDVLIEREEDGQLAILKRLEKALAKNAAPVQPPTPPSAEKPSESPRAIDLTSPVRIDAMRAQLVHALIRDHSVKPPFEARFDLNLRLSDLASTDRPWRFELQATAAPILDSLTIEGTGQIDRADLAADCVVSMKGLHLEPVASYLAPLGLRPVARNISLHARARVETKGIVSPDKDKVDQPPEAVRATIKLTSIAALADAEEALALDALTIQAERVGWREAHLGEIILQGARATALRTEAGVIRALGIEVVPVESSPAPTPLPAPVAVAPTTAPTATPFRIQLDLLALRQARVSWRDESMSPPANLALEVAELAAKNILIDPASPDASVELLGRLSAPAIVREITLEGKATPFAKTKTVELKASLAGIAPQAVAPYLQKLGLESRLEDGSLTTSLQASLDMQANGKLVVEAAVGRTLFADKQALLDFGGARLGGIEVDPQAAEVRIASVELRGPKVALQRLSSGAIDALGFRFTPLSPEGAAAMQAPTATLKPATKNGEHGEVVPAVARSEESLPVATASPASKAWKMRLDRFAWTELGAEFLDAAVEPAARLALEEIGIELSELMLDLAAAPTGTPGKLAVKLQAAGLADSIEVTGSLLPQPAQGSVQLNVAVKNITLAAAAPYLRAMGLEPALKEGSLAMEVAADYALTSGGITATAAISRLTYRDGAEELLGVDLARLNKLEASSAGVRIASVEVERPRSATWRGEDGVLFAGGVKLLPGSPAPPTGAAPAAASTRIPVRTEPFVLELGSLRVNAAESRWVDKAVVPQVATALRTSVALDNLVVGRKADPASLKIELAADGALEALTVSGHLALTPQGVSSRLAIDGRGIQAGPLAAYLPPGITSELRDGRLKTTIEVGMAVLDAGGHSARLEIGDVDFRDGTDPDAFLKLANLRVALPRLDPAGGHVDVDEISVTGLELEARKSATGAIEILGLSLRPPETPAEPKPIAAATDIATASPAARPQKLPLVTLKKIDLNLDRFRFLDEASAETKPLVASFRLANAAAWVLLGEEIGSNPPLELAITGKIEPLVESILVAIKTSPFTNHPELEVNIDITGIDGVDIPAIVPELKDRLDGQGLVDGRFKGRIEAVLKLNRRNSLDFDFSRGFGADLLLENFHFTNGKDGPVIAGLDGCHVDLARMDPKTGEVRVKEIELTKPILHARRTARGFEALGLLVLLPSSQETTAAPLAETVTDTTPVAAVPVEAPAGQPSAEKRLDKLLVSGLDVRFDDDTVQPTASLWLNGLEVDVRNATNRLLTEPQSVRFQVSAQAGKTPMPKPFKGSALLGALGDVASLATGQDVNTGPEMEDRAAFDDVMIQGKLGLYPQPTGFLETRVNAFDLLSIKGLAAQSGVILQAGTFDHRSMIRLPGDGSAHLDMPLAKLTDLDVSEPPDGPIFRYLHLPAPLDAILFALRDAEGGINLSLGVPKQPGPFGKSDLLAFGSEISLAIAKICATATASAPLRVVGGVTSMIPLGGPAETKPEEPITLEFAPGVAQLPPTEALKLAPLLERLRNQEPLTVILTHSFGADDLRRAAARANPSVEECLQLGASLRREKAELVREREHLAAAARAALASALAQEAPQYIERLRSLERRIAATDHALDPIYGLTRPGAERGAPRRTRDSALELGRARMEIVNAVFSSSGIENVADWIKTSRPAYPDSAPESPGKVHLEIKPRQGK